MIDFKAAHFPDPGFGVICVHFGDGTEVGIIVNGDHTLTEPRNIEAVLKKASQEDREDYERGKRMARRIQEGTIPATSGVIWR